MQAVILAGGLGTRLRAVVSDRPKPMALGGGRPLLEYLVERVRLAGCDEVILCVGHRHEQIEQHFADGARFGVRIRYAVEETLLGTGGALKNAEALLRAGTPHGAEGAFLAMNGDTLCDLDLGVLMRAHAARRAGNASCLGTLALAPVPDASDYGEVTLDAEGRLVAFREKSASAGPGLVNLGVYTLERELLSWIPAGRPVSLEREVFPAIVEGDGNWPRTQVGAAALHLFGLPVAGSFIDIGTPEGYRRFERTVSESA
jgi:NDP-sugar pyrophosphorylase family protein